MIYYAMLCANINLIKIVIRAEQAKCLGIQEFQQWKHKILAILQTKEQQGS